MSIKKISVKDFTVFNDIIIEASQCVNVLIGENGTGKTHLLKLLHSVKLWRSDGTLDLNDIFGMKSGITDYVLNYNETGGSKPNTFIKSNHCADDESQEVNRSKTADITIEFSKMYVPVFIPAKETLSMSNITRIDDKYSRNLDIDRTLIDIIKKAQNINPDVPSSIAEKIAAKLETVIDGKVFVKPDDLTFWVRKNNGMEIPFYMEAEGFRKIGLLWQLIMNEGISNGTVLLWDEPEANINPKLVPVLVEILLELARNGVQIFIATHDYMLAKYFEVRRKDDDSVRFHSLHRTDDGVKCEHNEYFRDLKANPIIEAFDELMDEVFEKNLGD